MTDQADKSQGENSLPEQPSAANTSKKRPFVLSIIALVMGVIALGLASIPALALDLPLPNPFAEKEEEKPRPEPTPEREGGITLKYKKFSVNLGGKVSKEKKAVEPEPELEITKDPARWFTISAIGCALVGLVISSIGQFREKHIALTASSMGCCVAAITWQYFAIGIFVGAAAAAFLIVLAMLGSALS